MGLESFSGAIQILVDLNGNTAYLTPQELYIYDSNSTDVIQGSLLTNESDLGEPTVDKLLNSIEIDFKGKVSIGVYLDGTYNCLLEAGPSSVRTTNFLYVPLIKRKAFQKVRLYFTTTTPGTVLYGTEIDFDILKKRKI